MAKLFQGQMNWDRWWHIPILPSNHLETVFPRQKRQPEQYKTTITDIKGKTETALTATSQVAKAIEHVATDVTTQVDLLSEIANNVEVMSGDGKEMNLSVNNVSEYVEQLNVSSNEMKEKLSL